MSIGSEKSKDSKTKAAPPKKDNENMFTSIKLADPNSGKKEEFYKFDANNYYLIPRSNQVD